MFVVIDNDSDTSRIHRARQDLRALRFMVGNKRAMVEEYARWYETVAKQVEPPYSARFRTPAPANMLREFVFCPTPAMWGKHVAMEAQTEVLRTEIALYRFKMANHRFPTALSDLCPQFLPSLPIDPCSGSARAPLRYSPKPDGAFLLYSIGPDMKDDGGVPAKRVGDMGGDIVAGELNKYEPILYSGRSRKQ
jgi:hypothetical protein